MLFVISGPIGNLADMTYRGILELRSCDYVLCEDTRQSRILLKYYDIEKPLFSYHKFNEEKKLDTILEDLKKGLRICLLSDAGTPGICDPGYKLIKRCIVENIVISSVPGPCALIAGLLLSGMPNERFQFVGFLPKAHAERKKMLLNMLLYPATSVCYESPHRLLKTLKLIEELDAERTLCIVRELTKLYEERIEGVATKLLQHFTEHPLKGEIVLTIAGKELQNEDLHLSPEEQVKKMQKDYGISIAEAIKLVAQLRKTQKNKIYQAVCKNKSLA